MKALYITSDPALAGILQQHFANLSAGVELLIRRHATDGRALPASGTADASPTDTDPFDNAGADVAIIDASPYDAIQPIRTLRDTSPTLPVLLLCGPEFHDPDDVSTLLGIDRVLVKSGDWMTQLVPALHALAGVKQLATQGVRERAAVETAGEIAASLPRFIADDAETRTQDADAYARASVEWNARLRALTAQQREQQAVLAAEQTRRDQLQRELNQAKERATELVSTLEAERIEASTRLQKLAAEHQQKIESALAERACADREEVVQWLKDAQNQLRERVQFVEPTDAEARVVRRKARLADLAVNVVTELDSLMDEVTASATRAVEAARDPSAVSAHLDRTQRTARRALDIARHFLLFSRWQEQPPEPTDFSTLVRDLRPTLEQLVGSSTELLARVEPSTATVPLSPDQSSRLLLSMAILCRDALPIGGQVIFDIRNGETVPRWNPAASRMEPVPLVCLTASVRGHAPQPIHATPSLEALVRECNGRCDEMSTEEPSTGLRVYLPSGA